MSEIKFYSPSYKRADTSITQDYLPYCKYVVAEFEANLEIKKGRKFIKILEGNRVWGFVNLTHERFAKGDLLKAAGYNAPALNRPRGNIFENYSVAWTGPHYISGYSAGGTREEGLQRGNSKMVKA